MNAASRFVLSALALAGALLVGLGLVDSPVPWTVRGLGAATMFLTLAPGLKYLADRPVDRRPVPLIPLVGLIYGLYFGRPFAFGAPGELGGGSYGAGSASILLAPALLALLGWCVVLVSYGLVGRMYRPRGWALFRSVDRRILRRAGVLLTAIGFASNAGEYFLAVPSTFAGVWTLLGRLGWVGVGFLVASWVLGNLGRPLKTFTAVSIVLVSLLEISTGSIANPGRFWLLLLLSGWIANGRRAPAGLWVAGVAAALTMIVLRGVAMDYRQRAWYGNEQLGPAEEVATYYAVLSERVRERGPVSLLSQSTELVRERTAQARVLTDVIQRTPHTVPYWGGETYVSLVGAFVPRFLWPSKPTKNLGQRFGHRYSYLDPGDETTSFNLPFLVEFYANFGALGILLGMSLVGGVYRLLDDLLNRPSNRALVPSLLALALLVPLATSVESDFSLVFGGLFLNGIALYGVLRLLSRRASRRERGGGPPPWGSRLAESSRLVSPQDIRR